MQNKRGDEWYPFYVDKWLFGSTRLELEPAERSVWIDLLTLSKKDNGYIRANEGIPYPIKQLAGLFQVDEILLQNTIAKALKYNKLKQLSDNTLYVCSTEKYALSERHLRRIQKNSTPPHPPEENKIEEIDRENRIEASGKADTMSEKADIKQESSIKLDFSFEKRVFTGIAPEDTKQWMEAYPAVDIDGEIRRAAIWLTSNPTKRKSNYRRFLTNWFNRTQERGGSNGRNQKQPATANRSHNREYKAPANAIEL